MGAQALLISGQCYKVGINLFLCRMLPPMKGMKKAGAKAMTKSAMAAVLAEEHGLKRTVCAQLMNCMATLASKEVKKTGKFVIPGICQVKTRVKPATKAGKKMIFGKEVHVKAKPAKTIVKAYPVAALKRSISVLSSK